MRLYAEALLFTDEDNDSGRGGTVGVLEDALDVFVVGEGVVRAFEAMGTDAPAVVAVGEDMVAGRCELMSVTATSTKHNSKRQQERWRCHEKG